MPPHHHPTLRVIPGVLCLGLFLAGGVRLSAQTAFVCLGGKTNLPSIIQIPAPGHGWDYSAAAPVPGVQWNRVRRPAGVDVTDPSIAKDQPRARLGIHDIDTAKNLPLIDPQGNPTGVKLDIHVEILRLATDKPRSEPTVHSKGAAAIPSGLMDTAWRVYLPDNRLRFTLSNLLPGHHYALYCYGTGVDPAKNPTGDGEGARFTLEKDNIPPGTAGTIETTGGFCGGIYTFSPETDRVSLSPAGTTWGRLYAVADDLGRIQFYTTRNANSRHYINGFQLIDNK